MIFLPVKLNTIFNLMCNINKNKYKNINIPTTYICVPSFPCVTLLTGVLYCMLEDGDHTEGGVRQYQEYGEIG